MSLKRTERTSTVFQNNLARLRKEFGVSHKTIGDAIGMTKSAVWKLEHGDSWPKDPVVIDKIADFFQVSVASLFRPGGAEEKAFQLRATEKEVMDVASTMLAEKRFDVNLLLEMAQKKMKATG